MLRINKHLSRYAKIAVLLSLLPGFALQAEIKPYNLICEYKVNPIGIDVLNPRLSWMLSSGPEDRNVIQTAYQVQVCLDEPTFTGSNLVWESGKIISDQSTQLVYNGLPVASLKRYYWRIKYWDNKGRVSKWSQPSFWEMGLLKSTDWKAKWIEADIPLNTDSPNPCPYLRKEINVNKKLKSARLYITSRGLYEVYLNDNKIGKDILTPGWTSYEKRLQYQTYDITGLIKQGGNSFGVILGDGWFKGNISRMPDSVKKNTKLALLFQLYLEFIDGESIYVISDESWKSSVGPIKMSDIYNGETYDARDILEGWNTNGYDDSNWLGVTVRDYGYSNLVAPAGVPVTRMKEIKPVRIFHTSKNELVMDMGQNMVGWIRLKASLNRGDRIVLTHAEVLDKNGNFYTENLREAKQKIEYIAGDDQLNVYEPHFTFQGFRYVKIEGFPGEPSIDYFTGIVIHSEIDQTGFFECSNKIINQLQSNIQWSQRGNFIDVPTDCPQRDERLGWTGDAQVFAPTACFNFDCAAFYTKWLQDLKADQLSNGSVPHEIPNVLGKRHSGSTGWGDAAVIIPWTMYLKYGDKRILEEQYESMKRWIQFLLSLTNDDFIIRKGFHYGDWLFFIHPKDWNVKPGYTDVDLIATAFFFYSTDIVEKTARILNKTEDVIYFRDLLKNIKSSFSKEFITPNGRLSSNSQTAYVLALQFKLLDSVNIKNAVGYLTDDIKKREFHLSTGFLGTPYICHVLSQNGYIDYAYKLLFQRTYPSWLYPITRGATTIWERWDGIKPDSSFQDPDMNSFNHYAYGAIGDWIYSNIAGFHDDEKYPGYKHFTIRPLITDSLNYAKSSFKSMYGTIRSEWSRNNNQIELNIAVPPNTSATVILYTSDIESITERGKLISDVFKSSDVTLSDTECDISLGSGVYYFKYQK
jgi:alpha-L-rhamnosidase